MHLAHSILDKFKSAPFRKRIHPANGGGPYPLLWKKSSPKVRHGMDILRHAAWGCIVISIENVEAANLE